MTEESQTRAQVAESLLLELTKLVQPAGCHCRADDFPDYCEKCVQAGKEVFARMDLGGLLDKAFVPVVPAKKPSRAPLRPPTRTSSKKRVQEYRQHLEENLVPGAFYEDCRHHPMVCVGLNKKADFLLGISLVDGTLGTCSYRSCGVVLLSAKTALCNRIYGLPDKIRDDILSFNWLPEAHHERAIARRRYAKAQKRGHSFPAENQGDALRVDMFLGKHLRRKKRKKVEHSG